MNENEMRQIIGWAAYNICRNRGTGTGKERLKTKYCRPTCSGGLARDQYVLKPCFHDPKRLELLKRWIKKDAGENTPEILEFLKQFSPDGESLENRIKEPPPPLTPDGMTISNDI